MIPLNVHSYYSLLSSPIHITNLIEKAINFNLNSLALTDTNSMYGLIQFSKIASQKGIKPILGSFIDDKKNNELSAILIAKNNKGYSELCKIITKRKLNDDFNLSAELNRCSKNIYIISSSLQLIKTLNDKKNLFAELIATDKKRKNTRELYNFAVAENIKYVASNPVFFLEKEDYILHKVLKAIKLNTTLENIKQEVLEDQEAYFKNPIELVKLWKGLPEAIENTKFIADNCNVNLKLGEYKFPKFNDRIKANADLLLRELSYEGLNKKYKKPSSHIIERLNYELSVIEELNFSNYFLIVADIVKEAQRRGMMIIGRGSAANSLVAYCLGFTQVDPVKYNLYFERFLNKGRSSPPDVDLDFSWKERDEIVKYVFERYGYQNVAMISTHITFRARSAFREVAKVFGISNAEISQFRKYIPWTDAANLLNLNNLFPESKKLNFKIEPWKSIISIAAKLSNIPRHLSIHPSGIVIAPSKITDFTALEYAQNKGLGLIVTQPDMYSIEDLGLIKIDLLSQRSLGVLRDTVNKIKKK